VEYEIVLREPPNGGCADTLSAQTRLRGVPLPKLAICVLFARRALCKESAQSRGASARNRSVEHPHVVLLSTSTSQPFRRAKATPGILQLIPK
jgi:hypothetical protein